ncbi:MAG: hypothetical protein F6K19_49320, partial [Cyanothece sp. SIO1E1]|nr:hypothetical protein [Cyanothece sp. SIO1E1]
MPLPFYAKIKTFTIFGLLWSACLLTAQEPILELDFEDSESSSFREPINRDQAVYRADLLQPQFAPGVKGKALDLSADALLRMPARLDSNSHVEYQQESSFSFQIWVKTKKNAPQGTPIAGNKPANQLAVPGWQVYSQENGAWALNLADSTQQYNYRPTAERQAINDGLWHQLLFTLDRDKQELWMYMDGRNVAIYNVGGLSSLSNDHATVIGGSDEKWEYGSVGQWYAFNGYIDEVKMWDRALTSSEVAKLYVDHRPQTLVSPPFFGGQLKVMAWNIWHGGHRYGQQVGVQRVIETIKDAQPDIVGLIETYGSGEVIADSLGYHFYLISSNLSIMSRFPILETVKAFRPFNFGGARLKIGEQQELLFLNTWLHYLPDYLSTVEKGKLTAEELVLAEADTRHAEVKQILSETQRWWNSTDHIPVIMSGDFNSGSHLDWTAATKDIHAGYQVSWPVSMEMEQAGF